ncbi:hypothetical protein FJZ39_03955 [Candidatus Saccharibacteria bacterium]|nr:hypothetical protein [Candidatus Saccharibacteria bacterium]
MKNDNTPRHTPHQPRSKTDGVPLQTPTPTRQATRWYKSTLFVVLLLVFIPPLGLILMWLAAPWKKYIKVLVTIPVIFSSAVFLLISATIAQSAITQIDTLKNERARMEQFLEEKYGKNFSIKNGKIVNRGDALLGFNFKTYEAEVSPMDDDSVVFTASRIVKGQSLDGGESSPDKLNYSDDYLLQSWTRELEEGVDKVVMNQPIGATDVNFRVGFTKTRASIAEFYDKIWGTAPTYQKLPLELKQELILMSDIKAAGQVDSSNIEDYASTMIAVRDWLDPDRQGLAVRVNSFEIYNRKEDKNPRWEWQNVGFIKLDKVESVHELTPYFIQWGPDTGRYYNPKSREFDMRHPE